MYNLTTSPTNQQPKAQLVPVSQDNIALNLGLFTSSLGGRIYPPPHFVKLSQILTKQFLCYKSLGLIAYAFKTYTYCVWLLSKHVAQQTN